MKKLMTISAVALLAASLSGAAFAQVAGGSGAGAAIPEKSGAAANAQGDVVGTTTGGRTTLNRGRGETTGMSGGAMAPTPNNAELQGNNGNSASGSNSLANPNTAAGVR